DADLPTDHIEELAQKLVCDCDSVGNYVPIKEADALEIYRLAL
ncbi:NADH-dependent alcohol dehydrogenase, partial [Turicibacter sanguinis]|nr:NADH-dependent alcohol dehydrogenase [Turicibacter sanguinis]